MSGMSTMEDRPDVLASPAPVLPRLRRRPAVAAAGLVLVLLGGLGTATLVGRAGDRVEVLAVARDVPAGQPVQAGDLAVARVPVDPALRPVRAGRRDGAVGMRAAVPLRAGSLLTDTQLTDRRPPEAGQQLVGLPLRSGQMPARGLAPGDRTLVVPVPGNDGGTEARMDPPPVAATVVGVGDRDEDGVTTVDVAVPDTAGPGLAELASTGRVAVLLLPAG